MALVYEKEFVVPHTECDPWRRMTPGAVLRRAQDIATEHCIVFNMDEEFYEKTHTVFLLSRLSLQVHTMPCVEEKITLQTRASGMHRAVYHRVSSMFGADGTKLCEVDSRWVLVDTNTRRILRKEPEGYNSPFVDMPEEEHNMDMPKPGTLEHIGDMQARYSWCDSNSHINNARYADMICDNLPLHKLEQGSPSRMLLFYRSEIPLGEEFSLYQSTLEEGTYFMAGQGTQRNFEAFVTF